jgi:hypothetical protein
MTASECAATLRRRWYVLALAGLFTLLALLAVYRRPIAYQGCQGVYLATVSQPTDWNVYLNLNTSWAVVAGTITQAMTSQPLEQQIRSEGVPGYTVTQTNTGQIRFPSYTQPTLQVCASLGSPQAVLDTTQRVTADLRAVLRRMQAGQGARKGSFITAFTLTPAVPAPVRGEPRQAYVGVVLIGALSGVALALKSDPLLSRRTFRRPLAQAPARSGSPHP